MSTNEPMTQEQLDAIQGRVDSATSGPWGCYGDGAHEVFNAGEYSDGDPGEVVAAVIDKLSDAVFVAEAREDIPALLAEVHRLRALTTVTDDMVERAAEAWYVAQNPGMEDWALSAWADMGGSEPSEERSVATLAARAALTTVLGSEQGGTQ